MGILEDWGISGIGIDITGLLSNTWIYVAIIVFVGMLAIISVGCILFFMTYKRKVVLFDNIAGQGYQPVLKTRARVIKLTGTGNDEVMKTLFGGYYLNAYARKMGKNTYWFAKGNDGFFYNFIMADLDTKKQILDVEPVDRDVRGFQIVMDRKSIETYMGKGILEKYGNTILMFLFLVVLILGMWFIIAKIGEATQPLAQSTDLALKVQESNQKVTERLEAVTRALGYTFNELKINNTQLSGISPAG